MVEDRITVAILLLLPIRYDPPASAGVGVPLAVATLKIGAPLNFKAGPGGQPFAAAPASQAK